MNNLDDCTIYVFVRGDLPEEQQLVQAAHAVFNMARKTVPYFVGEPAFSESQKGEPRIVALDGGSSEKAFSKTLRKLGSNLTSDRIGVVQYVEYVDPDHPEWGVTAIATLPLTKEQSLPLANYRLRRYSPPSAASAGVTLDGQRGASVCSGSSEAGEAEVEQPITNRQVVGSTPTRSANSQQGWQTP